MEVSELADMPTGFDQLEGFEAILGKVESSGKIVSVPTSKANFKELSKDQDLYKYVWERLYQLGYLSKSRPSSRLRRNRRTQRFVYDGPKLTAALKQFQHDANIINDGWLGLQTWTALQQLYTFDDANDLNDWLSINRRPALNKSIELRLRVLGIVDDKKPKARAYGVNRVSGLALWESFLHYLGVLPEQADEFTVLSYLYDLDKLTPLMHNNYQKIKDSHFAFKDKLLKKILIIELWLHGFDNINPNMEVEENIFKSSTTDSVSQAAQKLCEIEGLVDETLEQATDLDAVCLQYFANTSLNDTSAVESEKVANAIAEISKNEDYAQQLSTKVSEKQWGAWLFDGLKRAFRWVYKQLQKATAWISEKIEALAIAIKKLSLPAVSFYRRTVKILGDGISVFTNKLFAGSTSQYAIYRDIDFDFKVFIAESADSQEVSLFLNAFNAIWQQVYKTMAIALILMQIIKEALALASTSLIGLPFILARLYKFTRSADYRFIQESFAAQT